jgi:peptidoglycan/LPS O-acetylase OafA/YrhL
MAKMTTTSRFHGLDAARASMMLLGVLLHGLLFAGQYLDNHSVVEDLVLDGVYFTFHAFRLPAFFVLAGFFACMLIDRRGLDGFMRNRGMRLGLVLVIFTPIVVATTLFAKDRLDLLGNFEVIVRRGFLHLWFIYYLLIFSVVLFLVSRIQTSGRVTEFQVRAGNWISDPRVLVIAPLVLLIAPGFLSKDSLIRTSTSFVPDLPLLGLYGIFFVAGTLLFRAGTNGLEVLSKRAYLLCAIGLVSAQLAYGWGWTLTPGPLREFASMVASFYLALGIIGLFQRIISTTGSVWKYLSRTSYWVYLVHPPILWASLRLLKPFDLPASVTIAIALVGVVALSFATFELFVRRTALSKIV